MYIYEYEFFDGGGFEVWGSEPPEKPNYSEDAPTSSRIQWVDFFLS